jgi:hypothetical protein
MTSEICVMNQHALVLAADSAVTVSSWESGRKEERYFKGSNEIFQISNTEPIGAMIYDSADLQRIPWEIIVKTFRGHIGNTQFGTVAEYASEFFRFIEGSRGSRKVADGDIFHAATRGSSPPYCTPRD